MRRSFYAHRDWKKPFLPRFKPSPIRRLELLVGYRGEIKVAVVTRCASDVTATQENSDRIGLELSESCDDPHDQRGVEPRNYLDAIHAARSFRSSSVIPVAFPGGIARVSTAWRSMSSERASICSAVSNLIPRGADAPA